VNPVWLFVGLNVFEYRFFNDLGFMLIFDPDFLEENIPTDVLHLLPPFFFVGGHKLCCLSGNLNIFKPGSAKDDLIPLRLLVRHADRALCQVLVILQDGRVVSKHRLLHPGEIILCLPGAANELAPLAQHTPDFFGFCIWLGEFEMDEIKTIVPAHEAAQSDVERACWKPKIPGIGEENRSIPQLLSLYPRVGGGYSMRTNVDPESKSIWADLLRCRE
jgi:hypothetical protein